MEPREFYFQLPESLIAQHPARARTESRLLCLDGVTGTIQDHRFPDLVDFLDPGDLLVLNDTRVIPARLRGRKDSGGRIEVLIERALDGHRAVAQIRASKPLRPGQAFGIDGRGASYAGAVTGRRADFYLIRLEAPLAEVLSGAGDVPLPPYIQREPEAADRERYQTVYARHPGAVAAPTAGLHFDQALIDTLVERGVGIAFVTLHVGAGTFQPVRVADPRAHRMHAEWISVSGAACEAVRMAQANRRRVVAVGTTTVRALETAAGSGELRPFEGETRLFIYPGFRFRVVDAILTNFHLPGSTLLMLVCAYAGRAHVMAAYRHAVANAYRFYSYGDAMLVTCPHPGARTHEI